ncbi:MAG: hypothetical protein ACE5PV_27205, partial [Candidatus Poribacteria bacterium]
MTRRELDKIKEHIKTLEEGLAQLKADVARIETRLDAEEAAPPLEAITPKITSSSGVSGRNVDSKRCYQEVLQKLGQLGLNPVEDENARLIYHVNRYLLLFRFSKP